MSFGTGVGVGVDVGVGGWVGVGVGVKVGVGDGVMVGVAVGMGVGVAVGMAVGEDAGVCVGVGAGVGVLSCTDATTAGGGVDNGVVSRPQPHAKPIVASANSMNDQIRIVGESLSRSGELCKSRPEFVRTWCHSEYAEESQNRVGPVQVSAKTAAPWRGRWLPRRDARAGGPPACRTRHLARTPGRRGARCGPESPMRFARWRLPGRRS